MLQKVYIESRKEAKACACTSAPRLRLRLIHTDDFLKGSNFETRSSTTGALAPAMIIRLTVNDYCQYPHLQITIRCFAFIEELERADSSVSVSGLCFTARCT